LGYAPKVLLVVFIAVLASTPSTATAIPKSMIVYLLPPVRKQIRGGELEKGKGCRYIASRAHTKTATEIGNMQV
jgi:hypothetical protein